MQFTEAASEDSIMRLLSALPKLSHLFLSVPNDVDMKIPESLSRYFNNLSGLHFTGGTSLHCDTLKSIVAHSPNLITLSIDGSPLSVDGDRFVSIAQLVSAVPVGVSLPLQTLTLGTISFDSSIDCHLQSLTTLNITPDFLDVPPHFWNTLQSSRVKLQNLTVHQGDSPLLEYLQSYSGLVSLCFDLCGFRHNDRRDSDAMADVMYRGVLPMHTESLKVLHIRTPYEGKWTLGRSQLDGILTCRCLTSLVIGVGLSEVEAPEEFNVINRLLNAVDHNILPNIRVTRLFLAYPTSARAMGDSVLLMHSAHGVRGGALLNALVKKYTCAWPSSALIDLKLSTGHLHVGHASLNTFKLGRHRVDRQWRFSLQIQTSSRNVY
ncbi:hypothetical protein CPB85DRAFT_1430688 [Mucidula mucida]|nr:hypothetical protein CPB85DRAFT_1430688 [Mucidula mucida]